MGFRTLATIGKKEILREYQPQKRTIAWGNAYLDGGGNFTQRTLQFPFIQFFLHGNTLHVSFSKRPIKNLKSPVYAPTVGNVYNSWSVCGSGGESMDDAINAFWLTSFTSDGGVGTKALKSNVKKAKNLKSSSPRMKTTWNWWEKTR